MIVRVARPYHHVHPTIASPPPQSAPSTGNRRSSLTLAVLRAGTFSSEACLPPRSIYYHQPLAHLLRHCPSDYPCAWLPHTEKRRGACPCIMVVMSRARVLWVRGACACIIRSAARGNARTTPIARASGRHDLSTLGGPMFGDEKRPCSACPCIIWGVDSNGMDGARGSGDGPSPLTASHEEGAVS